MNDEKTHAQLQELLSACPEDGSMWRHCKTGNLYQVVGAAIQEVSLLPLVLYVQVADPVQVAGWVGIRFARPLQEWEELVEWEGEIVPRFSQA